METGYSQENTSKRYFDIHTTEEISKEQVEEKLSEFEKIGWTDNFHTFIEFVNYATQINEEVKSLYEFFAVHLSDEGQSYFNKDAQGSFGTINLRPSSPVLFV